MSGRYRLHESWPSAEFPMAAKLGVLNDLSPDGFSYVFVYGGENGENRIELLEYESET